jgi:hypothetical protein
VRPIRHELRASHIAVFQESHIDAVRHVDRDAGYRRRVITTMIKAHQFIDFGEDAPLFCRGGIGAMVD